MSSGVQVAQICLDTFQTLKLDKKQNLKYIIFNLSKDLQEIIVEKSSTNVDYEEFLSALPAYECRWAVYDFEFETDGNGKRNKLCFISWSPDDAKIKQKMLFASSRDALRKKLEGIAVEVQGTDSSEVSYETVLAKAKGNTR